MIWKATCSTYNLFIFLFSSLGGRMNPCGGWKAVTVFPPVSWVFTEHHFLGWPAGGSHTHCCVLYTQHNASIITTDGGKKKPQKTPLPFHHSYLPSLVWYDKVADCWWPLHLSATLCEWESACVCVFLFCLFGVAAVYGRRPHEATHSTGVT